MPMGELTKQNSWTRIPVSKSVCPQMSGSTSAWPHSAHTAEERANASSGEQLAGPDVPEGCPQGPALCLPCWLEVVEGKGPWQAPGSHSPSWAPLPRSRGAQPHACLGAPACPFLPAHLSAAGRGPAPLCPASGAVHRDAVLSPGSSELEAFRFLSDMMCVNSEHCESPCSLHASPGRTDAQAEPGSYCCAPGFARHNGRTLTPTVTSRSPPDGGCGRGPLASRQEASRQFQATPQLLWATFERISSQQPVSICPLFVTIVHHVQHASFPPLLDTFLHGCPFAWVASHAFREGIPVLHG